MKINEFSKFMHAEIDKFVQYWEKMKVEEPDNFPEEMELVDWAEQFDFWLERL